MLRIARLDFFSYKAFFSQTNLISYALPLFERLEGNALQLTVMEKDIFSLAIGDKTIAALINQMSDYTSCHDTPQITKDIVVWMR